MKHPPYPGELIRIDVLQSLGQNVNGSCDEARRAKGDFIRVLNGHMGISPYMALRLERTGVNNARFWMAVQSDFELSKVDRKAVASVRPCLNIEQLAATEVTLCH